MATTIIIIKKQVLFFRTPSSESVIMPPARGSQCDKQGIVTGTLKINVTGLQGQGGQAGQSDAGGQEPCEEEERRQKVKDYMLRQIFNPTMGPAYYEFKVVFKVVSFVANPEYVNYLYYIFSRENSVHVSTSAACRLYLEMYFLI